MCLAAKMKYHARGTETTRKLYSPSKVFPLTLPLQVRDPRIKILRLILLDMVARPAVCHALLVDHFTESYTVQQEYQKSLLWHGFEDSFFQHIPEGNPKNDRHIFLDQGSGCELSPLGFLSHRQKSFKVAPCRIKVHARFIIRHQLITMLEGSPEISHLKVHPKANPHILFMNTSRLHDHSRPDTPRGC